jgi:hypothetical protein
MPIDWESALADVTGQKITLERIFTDPLYFGMKTATPLQRALCRVIGGDPLFELAYHPHVQECLGDVSMLDGHPPKEMYIAAGIRSGKSLLNAAAIVHWAFNGNFSHLGPGEVPRISIISVEISLAEVTLGHLIGRCEASPALRPLVSRRGDYVYIRQPKSGREVEVAVVANKREGASLIARWQAGVVFDEISRIASGSDSVINIESTRAATLERLVPGGGILGTGSPTAPQGFFYDIISRHSQNPTVDLIACKAPAYYLNPVWWTEARCEEARKRDPEVYRTDVLAEFLSPESAMFNPLSIDESIMSGVESVPYQPGATYIAAMDAATRSNGWTLVIATKIGNKRKVVYANEWRGSAGVPLDSKEVMYEIGEVLKTYKLQTVFADGWLADPLIERAREFGFSLAVRRTKASERSRDYRALQDHFEAGNIQIPDNRVLRSDLVRVRKIPMPTGGVSVKLPHTNDGRHCDYIPSLVGALSVFCRDYEAVPDKEQNPVETMGSRLKEARFKQVRRSIQKQKTFERNMFGRRK